MIFQVINKLFKSTEETINMFLGLVIVIVIIGLIFNYFLRLSGTVDVPGISTTAEEEVKTIKAEEHVVKRNDCLWKIAVAKYGDGYRWVDIWKENKNKLNSPDLLEIGMVLTLP
jgi:hypothetical protein